MLLIYKYTVRLKYKCGNTFCHTKEEAMHAVYTLNLAHSLHVYVYATNATRIHPDAHLPFCSS